NQFPIRHALQHLARVIPMLLHSLRRQDTHLPARLLLHFEPETHPIFFAEFRARECLPKFLRRRPDVRRVNEFKFFILHNSSSCFQFPVQLALQKIFNPFPVSRNVFRLDSTFGQPAATFSAMSEPVLKLSCVTVRQTMSSTGSISNVTRDSSFSLSGSSHVNTNRFGGALSITLP